MPEQILKVLVGSRAHGLAGAEWEERVDDAYKFNPNRSPRLDVVNDALLDLRFDYWDEYNRASGIHRDSAPSRLAAGADEERDAFIAKLR